MRHVQVNAQPAGLGDAEEQRRALGDQNPGIHVTQRDDAGKGGAHGLVILKIVQARQVGLGRAQIAARRGNRFFERVHVGLLGGPLGPVGVVFLARDHAFVEQLLPAVFGDFGQLQVGLALHQVGLRLLDGGSGLVVLGLGLDDLLLDFRRLDFRQHLAGGNAVADIDQTFANVAGGARQHGSLGDGLDAAGQHQAGLQAGALDLRDVHLEQALG